MLSLSLIVVFFAAVADDDYDHHLSCPSNSSPSTSCFHRHSCKSSLFEQLMRQGIKVFGLYEEEEATLVCIRPTKTNQHKLIVAAAQTLHRQ